MASAVTKYAEGNMPLPLERAPVKLDDNDKQLVTKAHALPIDRKGCRLGRPRQFDSDVARRVIELMTSGWPVTKAMRAFGLRYQTFHHWSRLYPDFADAARLARVGAAHQYAEDILDIADDSSDDWKTITGKDGREWKKLDSESARRSQIRIDVRWKLMASYDGATFGDRKQVEVSGNVTTTAVDLRLSLHSASSPEARALANAFSEKLEQAIETGNPSTTDAAPHQALPLPDPQPLTTPPPPATPQPATQ